MNEQIITKRNEKNRPERFLVGQDDGADFSVKVPLRVKTVEAAIEWLRPAGVLAGTPRQGEYFFIPQTEGFEPSSLEDETWTDAGSARFVRVFDGPMSFHRHAIERSPDLAENAAISHAVHDPNCAVCDAKLKEGECLYGVKNAETREYRCVVAASSEEAKEKIGWDGTTLYVMRVRSYQPPMAEETKAKLRQIQAERKAVCGPRRKQ